MVNNLYIVLLPTKNVLKRTLLLSLTGTRGGIVRLKILMMLNRKSYNTNEISKNLFLDYKTVQHHIRVLEKSNLITSSRKRYANSYRLSSLLGANKDMLKEIWEKVDKGKNG